jgi:hypothetical protein
LFLNRYLTADKPVLNQKNPIPVKAFVRAAAAVALKQISAWGQLKNAPRLFSLQILAGVKSADKCL